MPQNKTNHHKPNTNTLILVSLIPNHTQHMKYMRYLSSPENKNLPPPGTNQHPHSDKTKILYSP